MFNSLLDKIFCVGFLFIVASIDPSPYITGPCVAAACLAVWGSIKEKKDAA